MAKIYVNGDSQEISLPLNLTQLIADNHVTQPEMVSVQLNGNFVERGDWDATALNDGDSVDFLYFMGGGSL